MQPHGGRPEASASSGQAGTEDNVQTDNETNASVSSSLMWQEDPEFQEKLRYAKFY